MWNTDCSFPRSTITPCEQFFIMFNKAYDYAPRLLNLGFLANLQPLDPMLQHLLIFDLNVIAFINNLGSNNKPKMLKVGPKFFQP